MNNENIPENQDFSPHPPPNYEQGYFDLFIDNNNSLPHSRTEVAK